MTAEIIFRILGFILFGIIGWLIGTVLADTDSTQRACQRGTFCLDRSGRRDWRRDCTLANNAARSVGEA